jgi:hypothetical protein
MIGTGWEDDRTISCLGKEGGEHIQLRTAQPSLGRQQQLHNNISIPEHETIVGRHIRII